MDSIRFKIENQLKFEQWLFILKNIGILGDFLPIGTSIDYGLDVNKIKYNDDMLEFNVSLENNYLVTNYPKSFKYKNILVSINTTFDINAGDVGKFICSEDEFIDKINILMKNAI